MRPVRCDHLLDRRISGEPVDRSVEIDIERDQPRQRRLPVDRTAGAQRRLELGAGSSGIIEGSILEYGIPYSER